MQAWERKRIWKVGKHRVKFREIWIKSGRKVSPALSNDFQRSLEEVVRALVGRWGNQENMFKELKAHGIDRIHSYRKESFDQEYLYSRGLETEEEGIRHRIENPKVRELTRRIALLRRESRKVAQKILTGEKKGMGKKLTGLRRKEAGLARQIANMKRQRAGLPKKVLMIDRIAEDKIIRLSDCKKLFFDWLKMNAIWAEKMLVGVATPFYKDLRDVNKFILSVLQSRTYVRREGETLHVAFPPRRSKNGRLALEAICEFLNNKGSFDLRLTFNRLSFSVGIKH
jgi:hypothetical protein